MSERADWQQVGIAFRDLGRELKGKAVEGGQAVRDASSQPSETVTDRVSTVLTTALHQFDQASADPEVSRAAKLATARLLDAIKAELTQDTNPPEDRPPTAPPPVAG
ncbi:MAG: hypothetical protein ACKOE2_08865 [Actinomycetales bacterium]